MAGAALVVALAEAELVLVEVLVRVDVPVAVPVAVPVDSESVAELSVPVGAAAESVAVPEAWLSLPGAPVAWGVPSEVTK
jgi:hypothetical protein